MATQTTPTPTTIPYASAAAGHQGISTTSDGTLLIKPCTQAEIDFYESAKAHPNFQVHMPTYMGSLTLNNDPIVQSQASALQGQQTKTQAQATTSTQRKVGIGAEILPDRKSKRVSTGAITSEPGISRTKTKEWTPSGGAKLTSNLSICLSNATSGFVRPNVIDLKLGARLWDDDAPLAKRAKLDEVANTSTSGSLGFRVAGMKVFIGEGREDTMSREVNTMVADGYKTYDKFYGRNNISERNIKEAFEAFLYSLSLPTKEQDGQSEMKALLRRRLLIERLLREVSSIEYVLENEESRMYSASILMVYEGDVDALDSVIKYEEKDVDLIGGEAVEEEFKEDEDEDDQEESDEDDSVKQKIHNVTMIDFAHAKWTPGQGPDENALRGVRSIRQILEDLLVDVQAKLSRV